MEEEKIQAMESGQTEKGSQAEQFFSYRGIAKCFSAGISFLTDHFRHFLWLGLPVMLLYAAFLTVIVYSMTNRQFTFNIQSPAIYSAIHFICMIAITAMFSGLVYRMVCHYIDGHNLDVVKIKETYDKKYWSLCGQSALAYLVLYSATAIVFCICLLPAFLLPHDTIEDWGRNGIISVGLMLIAALAMIPANLCTPTVLLEDEGNIFQKLWRGYRRGWHKWGKLFALMLLIFLLLFILVMLLEAPAVVLSVFHFQASMSALEGDAVNIPAYFTLLTAAMLFISMCLIIIITWAVTMPLIYFYASVRVDEQEKAKNTIPLI